MDADSKSSASGGAPKTNGDERSRGDHRPGRRPPFFAIFLLSGFLLLVLSFVTFRQIRSGEANRLRLLAGFSGQVEATVPELVTRFIKIVEQEHESCTVAQGLATVPNLSLIAGPLPPRSPAAGLEIRARGTQVFIHYQTEVPSGLSATCDETETEVTPAASAPTADEAASAREVALAREAATVAVPVPEPEGEEGEALALYIGRLDLAAVIDPIVIPDVFDLIVLARGKDEHHEVLFQQGEPELKLDRVTAAWEVRRAGLLEGLTERLNPERPAPPSGAGTRVVEAEIAGKEYRIFLQPVTLHLRDPNGSSLVSERWIASGLISWERLLASSFTTSPVLLFLMVALFPVLLAVWPFLKLALISKNQRFTRFDVAALLFSCLLAVALGTFLILDSAFMSRVKRTVDRQLEELAETLSEGLREEIGDAARQLAIARQIDPETRFASFALRSADPPERSWAERAELLPRSWGGERETEGEESPELVYPLMHSIFWADADGEQLYKVPFHGDSILRNVVADRGYFRCAQGKGDLELRQTIACEGCQEPLPVCIQSIRSKTTAEDVTALAVPIERPSGAPTAADTTGAGSSRARDPEPVAVVIVTRLATLERALLAPGFAFAVVDAEGKVQYHSDRRRSASEDLSRAAAGDRLLASMLEERRTGSLAINYWGRRYQAFVRPIADTPWSIVTLRDARELRARNFELLFDFLNLFLPYLVVACLILLVVAKYLPLGIVRYLWPSRTYTAIYRTLAIAAPVVVGAFALLVSPNLPWLTFAATVLAPVTTVLTVVLAARLVARRAVGTRAPADRERRRHLDWWPPLAGVLMAFAAARLRPGFVLAVLAVSTLVGYIVFLRRRKDYDDQSTPGPYVAAFAIALFSTAVLPAIGFFLLAESRQSQFLVQDSQVGLALAEGRFRNDTRAERPPLADDLTGYDEYFDSVVGGARTDATRVVFDSVLMTPGGTPPAATSPRWPYGRGGERSADRSGEGGESAPDPPSAPLARLVAARLVPLSDLTPQTTGIDLSRFGFTAGTWHLGPPGCEGDGRRLIAELEHVPGVEGALWVSSTAGDDPLAGLSGFRGLLIWLLWLALLALTILLGYVVATRVLLVNLAPNRRHATLEKILALASPSKDPKRILLIFSLPEAVEQMARGEERTGSFHVLRFATLWNAESDPRKREIQLLAPLEREERLAGGGAAKRATLLISDFRPDLRNPAVAKEQIEMLECLRLHGGGNGRSVIIVSSRPYHLLARAERGSSSGDEDGSREARAWWGGYLARFTQRYGRDAGKPTTFREYFEWKKRRVRKHSKWSEPQEKIDWFAGSDPGVARDAEAADDEHELATSDSRSLHRLLDTIYDECRWTWRLQRVGLEIVGELADEITSAPDERRSLPTKEQLVSRIEFAALPYYQRIWDACDRSEKLVLHQLARESVVNPKGFDVVLDLLNKGLIVREPRKPVLRLMNQSFARFVTRTVARSEIVRWEDEEGFSAWEVWKWVLPLPLLLLGVFLFITQQDAVSNVVGLLIALASLLPTGFNLYQHFQQVTAEREAGAGR